MRLWRVIRLFSLLQLIFEIVLNTGKRNLSLQMANENGLAFASFFKFQQCPLFAAGLCVGVSIYKNSVREAATLGLTMAQVM